MNCREFTEFLMAYLDGELEAGEKSEFETHLRVCEDCVDYLEGYKDAVQLGRGAYPAGDEPAAGRVPENLVQAILAARGKRL
jgi:anti-sigma factor RsiW